MAKLVIVESPAKAKTISRYLGKGYKVKASMGHLRDLPRSKLGVDIEGGFVPEYINIQGKAALIKELKAEAASASGVLLATDPDREGEAISWHLSEMLGVDGREEVRVIFNEITEKAVNAGVQNPRPLNMDLVDAQQARRVLDRILGYKLSPYLWKRVRSGLSAGRVQSVATRLVVDREEEIRAFVPEEYWHIDALLNKMNGAYSEFRARLHSDQNGKLEVKDQQAAESILSELEGAAYAVSGVKKGEKKRTPPPPFITSALQQEASNKLGFPAKRTMMVAQQLYEGVDIPGRGQIGLITYMRTDSTRLSDEAVTEARKYIAGTYGKDYLPASPRVFKQKAGAQDAHEAIRPSYPELKPDELKDVLPEEQYKLYKLIWDRFMACQMSPLVLDTVTADIGAGRFIFRASGFTVRFPGYTVLYEDGRDAPDEEENTALPPLTEGEPLNLKSLTPAQKFTQPPPRYTEATLIRELEENGIGRPSTYAAMISTIMDRDYVAKEGRSLRPNPLGEVVTGLMKAEFPDVVGTDYTARMEKELDEIEEGRAQWKKTLEKFYAEFKIELDKAEISAGERVKVPDEETDVICEKCGRNMVVKHGRFGKFLSCPGYPECKTTKAIAKETPGICPKCGGPVMAKKSKNGNTFYGCDKYPACDFMTWDVPVKNPCPNCGKPLFRHTSREQGRKNVCLMPGCGYEQVIWPPKPEGEGEKKAVKSKTAKTTKKTTTKKATGTSAMKKGGAK